MYGMQGSIGRGLLLRTVIYVTVLWYIEKMMVFSSHSYLTGKFLNCSPSYRIP